MCVCVCVGVCVCPLGRVIPKTIIKKWHKLPPCIGMHALG